MPSPLPVFCRMDPVIHQLPADEARHALHRLVTGYSNPAFGALPRREVDLLFLEEMVRIGLLPAQPSLYDLVHRLRISRSKARSLLYDRDLRRMNPELLDRTIREILQHPLLQKQGELYALEVENPLVADHLRARLKELNHTCDGSFSASLLRLTPEAVAALIEFYLNEEERASVRDALIAAGFPDRSLKALLTGALQVLGKKVADQAGSALAAQVGEYITCLITAATDRIRTLFRHLSGPGPIID